MIPNINIAGYSIDVYNTIVKDYEISNTLLAKVLASRGFSNKQQIYNYLHPNLDRDWVNPYEIEGMEDLANSVENAIRNNKRILIYGDYDLDGISAIAVMMLGLKEINRHANANFTVDFFIPDRFNEGYGLSEASLNRLLKKETLPEFIITVDCGITSDKEIKFLKSKGIEVVVTDHHEKSDGYPKEVCLIDPKAQNDQTDDANLAGVGVALKLICVLGSRFGMPNMWRDLVDIAMLGTVADIMPLVGQNRALVHEGLRLLNLSTRPCLRALIDAAGRSKQKFSSTDLGFAITPRLNSAGRLNKPELALKLLLAEKYADAFNLAIEIENANNKRKEITDDLVEKATYQAKQIVGSNASKRCLVLSGEGWHDGVRGIVAAKISSEFKRPTIIFNIKDDIAVGSGRSYGDINLHDACLDCWDKFLKFGGHKSACGATIKKDELDNFSNALEKCMQNMNEEAFYETIKPDFEINLKELSIENVSELNMIEPLGKENNEPLFLLRNVFLKNAKAVGVDHNHLSCYITDGANGANAIMFFVDDIEKYLKYGGSVSVVCSAKVEEFNGRNFVKLYLEHVLESKHFEVIEKSSDQDAKFIAEIFANNKGENRQTASVGDFIDNALKDYNWQVVDKFCKDEVSNNEITYIRDKYRDMSQEDLMQDIVKSFIGKDGSLHKSQQDCLDILAQGKSAMSIMPTGRGKSLIFQVFATMIALKQNKLSIFVYPLRALIADQAYHLQCSLDKFGIKVCVLNGETTQKDRQKVYDKMQNGQVDIILTTPEFLSIHVKNFAENAQVAFVVIDECHHLGEVRIGQRSAYGHMPHILEKLNNPQVLALSATVSDDVFSEVQNYLPVTELIKDNFERENLFIDDRRNLKCRDEYLASLCASGQKTLVYVNSRQQTIDLARMIKSRAPHIATKVGFYNAGMTKDQRGKIEQMFRNNKLFVLVATSAFGEGVNIPDVRHVCLYHLPFSSLEFNQMCGRSGRDNNPALIHLLYNRADATINTQILNMTNPNRDELGKIYIWIKSSCKSFNGAFKLDHDNLLKMNDIGTSPAAPAAIFCALDIFSELGLINVKTNYKDGQTYSTISLVENAGHVNLEDSSRFCEGLNEISQFNDYRNFAMRTSANALTNVLRHPILPKKGLNSNL